MIENYQVIVNLLPEIRKWIAHDRVFSVMRPSEDIAQVIQETLLRYIGFLDDGQQRLRKEIRNPAIWLREGVQWLLAIPLEILVYCGIAGSSLTMRFHTSRLTRVLAGMVSFVGLLSALVTLLLGWSQSLQVIMSFLQR